MMKELCIFFVFALCLNRRLTRLTAIIAAGQIKINI
jgi:hypothetical protein